MNKFVRAAIVVGLYCQTFIEPRAEGEKLTRDHVTCKITYTANVNPGGWAPPSVVRAVSKREYPKFLRKISSFCQNACKDKPISMWVENVEYNWALLERKFWSWIPAAVDEGFPSWNTEQFSCGDENLIWNQHNFVVKYLGTISDKALRPLLASPRRLVIFLCKIDKKKTLTKQSVMLLITIARERKWSKYAKKERFYVTY